MSSRKARRWSPSFSSPFAVVTLLERHFGHLSTTTSPRLMEGASDEIARGEAARCPGSAGF